VVSQVILSHKYVIHSAPNYSHFRNIEDRGREKAGCMETKRAGFEGPRDQVALLYFEFRKPANRLMFFTQIDAPGKPGGIYGSFRSGAGISQAVTLW
jgi:hypothetical protein